MIVGIDLGTTNSLIGAMDSGFPFLFADSDGNRLTPSVVAFDGDGTARVGWEAIAASHAEPGRLIYSIKRLMGARSGDAALDLAYELVAGDDGSVAVQTPLGPMAPEEISALILQKLKSDAERSLGKIVDRAVITVPAYFNDSQRTATKRAGELAGFVVERIVSEPTAAALAYGLDRLGDEARVAVFDLGGGTFDISILELSGGVFDVRATDGDTRLGGDDFDAAIAREFGISRIEAKGLKERSATMAADDATRLRVESVCRPVLERTRARCERALSDSQTRPGGLSEVILVGGATRMPMVARFVEEIFGLAPNTSQHPDEAVALGAAIQAGILDGVVQNMTLLDVTPLSLGIETFGGLMNVIIPRNTTIPVKRGEMFTNAVANQSAMRISILQGEREMASDNWKLGEIDVPFSPAARGQGRVGVQFEIDADGILQVLARDIASGIDHRLDIRSAVVVEDAKVEEMVSASVEHAFEDVTARQLAELRIKADEMLPAIEAGLAQVGDHLTAEERDRIVALSEAVKTAIAEGNLQALKKLVRQLDDETQNLATLLIEALL